ncbi:MAG: preprotein translocase subunit SecG [Bacteroidetes bacterium]|nr:preprotein translocase subunit SecG [Bacteroidota bacterium]
MATFLSILIILVSILLVLVVLVQSPKGGIDAAFGASSQFFGVRRTADFLEKTTWILIGVILVLSLLITSFMGTGGGDTVGKSEIEEDIQSAQPVQNVPPMQQEIPAPQQVPAGPAGK